MPGDISICTVNCSTVSMNSVSVRTEKTDLNSCTHQHDLICHNVLTHMSIFQSKETGEPIFDILLEIQCILSECLYYLLMLPTNPLNIGEFFKIKIILYSIVSGV